MRNISTKLIIIIFILLTATILRFYGLMHDSPHFFNPDERNMAIAITRFTLPNKLTQIPSCIISELTINRVKMPIKEREEYEKTCNLNPHFFAYSQFPLYLAYISDQLTKPLIKLVAPLLTINNGIIESLSNRLSSSFPSAVFWLRFWSALSSTLTVVMVYLISKQLLGSKISESTRISSQISTDNQRESVSLSVLIPPLLAAFTPGLIQAAHFGTTESFLTFFFIVSIYYSLKIFDVDLYLSLPKFLILNTKYLILLSLSIGLALGSKLTGLFFLFPPFIALLFKLISSVKSFKKLKLFSIFKKRGFKEFQKYLLSIIDIKAKLGIVGLIILLGSALFFVISSPYNLVEQKGFLSTVFGYESDVATGRYDAFYTRQFYNSIPVLFQMKKIFPYALGLPVFMLGLLGLILLFIQFFFHVVSAIQSKIKNYNIKMGREGIVILKMKFEGSRSKSLFLSRSFASLRMTLLIILLFSFLIYFLPNSFLYAKWTRFMTPVFPFFAIFAGYFLSRLTQLLCHPERSEGSKRQPISITSPRIISYRSLRDSSSRPACAGRHYSGTQNDIFIGKLGYYVIGLLVFISIVPGLSFMSIYTHEDSRVTASKWIYENIPSNSYVLSETANVVDIPVGIEGNEAMKQFNNVTIISFDFYHMDENLKIYSDLFTHLEKADFIFIPSRRIFKNYPLQPQRFKLTNKYHQLLFSGKLGFEREAEFSSFPSLGFAPLKINFNDEDAEESFTVFDHPVIRIYRKIKPMTQFEYRLLFAD